MIFERGLDHRIFGAGRRDVLAIEDGRDERVLIVFSKSIILRSGRLVISLSLGIFLFFLRPAAFEQGLQDHRVRSEHIGSEERESMELKAANMSDGHV